MNDKTMKYKEFTYDSALDVGDDVMKYYHYVYWREEFVGMMSYSSYSLPTEDEFKAYCDNWMQARMTDFG